MSSRLACRALMLAGQLLLLVLTAPVRAAQVDPSILSTLDYDKLEWYQDTRPTNPGSWYTTLSGNMGQSGPFVILNKIVAGNFDQAHFHPFDREIYVVKGTWWVGTGPNQNGANKVAYPAGSYVTQKANEVHWDGAGDEDVLLLIESEGPAMDTFVK